MSVNQSACTTVDDDTVKKRRLPVSSPNALSSSSLIKSPQKKRFKRNSLEQVLPNKTVQRIKSDFNYNNGSTMETGSIQDYKVRTPCYKKTVFPDSPVKTDPYDLPETPHRPRKLIRAKARTNLLESCSVSTESNTHEDVKAWGRRPPSSPHPGKDAVLCKKQGDEDAVPSVSFNSLASSGPVTPSSATRVPGAKGKEELMVNLKTPTSRGCLKHHSMSTSGLKTRLPVVVNLDGQSKSDISNFNLSKLNSPLRATHQRASVSLISLVETEGTPNRIRRQKSSNFEMITNRPHGSPGRNLRLTPERLKSLSLVDDASYPRKSSPLKKKLSSSALVVSEYEDKHEVVFEQKKNLDLYKPSTSDAQSNQTTSIIAQREALMLQEVTFQEEMVPITNNNGLQESDIVFDSQELPGTPLKSILRPSRTEHKEERHIKFGSLDVYYFGRAQGFEVVPKQGEVALGMGYSHFQARQFKILETKKQNINIDDPEESELSEDEERGLLENNFFEKSQAERIKILETAGVAIEKQKKNNLIRQGRDQCGCSCRGGVCKPSSCECFRQGIRCQVDGPKENGSTFPCTCYNPQLCSNEYGRDAYDFERVTKSRRAAIQRWKDREKTGIHAPSRLIKFHDNDEEVVADSQELFSNRNSSMEDYQSSSVSLSANSSNANITTNNNSFFPPSQSLL